MKCPKRFGSFSPRIIDCKECKQALLYQMCGNSHIHSACAGWNDKNGLPFCCECYTIKYSKAKKRKKTKAELEIEELRKK